ncbi:hypothetical protein [Pantoea sp. 9140]|uniref:hypothetical protein n=1 Tax=Pantoea sp. 9140 TaxID=1500896 RepID=UPI00053592FA|nr:hypothetical protein [Pantoea sp. 9140]
MNKFFSLCLCVLLLPSITSASEKMKLKDIKWLQGISEVKAIGCDSYEDSTYSSTGRDELEITESSFREKRLNPDSKITCDLWAKTDDIKKPVLQVLEEFKIDGVNVHIYHSDASGTIGKDYSDNSAWNSACKSDTMTDEVTCYVSHKSFYMFKNKTGYYLLVGSDHFPQTVAYIRLGKDKPISSGKDGVFSSADSLKIIESINNQTTLSTRYTKWPYETPVDEKLDTKYFEQAKKVLDLIFDNHV